MMRIALVSIVIALVALGSDAQRRPPAGKLLTEPALGRYITASVRGARDLDMTHESGVDPCVPPDTRLFSRNNASIGEITDTRIYGLSHYRVRGTRFAHGKGGKLNAILEVYFTQLFGTSTLVMPVAGQVYEGKIMYNSPPAVAEIVSTVSGTNAIQLQDSRLTKVFGSVIVDTLMKFPLKRYTADSISITYAKMAKACLQRVVPVFERGVNRVLRTRSIPEVARGVLPLPPKKINGTRQIRDTINFFREVITKTKQFDFMQLPILRLTIGDNKANLTGLLRGLAHLRIFYTSDDPANLYQLNAYIRYPLLQAYLRLSIGKMKMQFLVAIMNTKIHFKIATGPGGKKVLKTRVFDVMNIILPPSQLRQVSPRIRREFSRSITSRLYHFLVKNMDKTLRLKFNM